jgi:hypothetical protein
MDTLRSPKGAVESSSLSHAEQAAFIDTLTVRYPTLPRYWLWEAVSDRKQNPSLSPWFSIWTGAKSMRRWLPCTVEEPPALHPQRWSDLNIRDHAKGL